MVPVYYVRSELIAAVREATRGLSDIYVIALKDMPPLDAPGARDVWVYALGGYDGGGGLLADARTGMARVSGPGIQEAWGRAYDLARCLRNYLVSLPEEKASCDACEAFGCSGCDGTGLLFGDARAA
ncbi:hypothetical protein WMF30_10915 [Sorangium sp. So ce134]